MVWNNYQLNFFLFFFSFFIIRYLLLFLIMLVKFSCMWLFSHHTGSSISTKYGACWICFYYRYSSVLDTDVRISTRHVMLWHILFFTRVEGRHLHSCTELCWTCFFLLSSSCSPDGGCVSITGIHLSWTQMSGSLNTM